MHSMAALNQTPGADRIQIAFFGRRNAGKSSLVNAVTGQEMSIVSEVKGTTTDPVTKSMELLPLGPVVIIDTPGLDDEGTVGEMRVRKARQVLNRADIAVLVADITRGLTGMEEKLITLFQKKRVPYLIVYNKKDLVREECFCLKDLKENEIAVSALKRENIEQLKERIGSLAGKMGKEKPIVGELLEAGDHVVLVTPIDTSAPKGRMILPQVKVIRDILDAHGTLSVTQTGELPALLSSLKERPRLVITDSQAFECVKQMVPKDILLTSFSILFARYKGVLAGAVQGAAALDRLKEGDRILISEGCTHHRQCEDIGTVKLPGWIEKHTGKRFVYEFTSGGGFPEDLSSYALVVHCGGCMLNEREIRSRERMAAESSIPFTNYGILIAYMNGILKRSLQPFKELAEYL